MIITHFYLGNKLLINSFPINLGGGEICSGKGDCVCGECQCIEEDGGRYSGQYCDECPVRQNSFL